MGPRRFLAAGHHPGTTANPPLPRPASASMALESYVSLVKSASPVGLITGWLFGTVGEGVFWEQLHRGKRKVPAPHPAQKHRLSTPFRLPVPDPVWPARIFDGVAV